MSKKRGNHGAYGGIYDTPEMQAALDADQAKLDALLPEPEPHPDTQDAGRWRAFYKRAFAGVTEDGDIWIGVQDGAPEECEWLTARQRDALAHDTPSRRMSKAIVRRWVDMAARSSTTEPPHGRP